MTVELHDLACYRDKAGRLVCSCRPLFIVTTKQMATLKLRRVK